MSRYVVYEIWTRSRVIDAVNWEEACDTGSPEDYDTPGADLSLSNWHVVCIGDLPGAPMGPTLFSSTKEDN